MTRIGAIPASGRRPKRSRGSRTPTTGPAGAYNSQVTALLNGFSKAHGTDWSWNTYNDDICWAAIAYTRGYQATGNAAFRTIAKKNFDMMFARAWNPARGTLYWTTNNTSYNSCIECPAGIASYLLSKALRDDSYLSKAQDLYAWEKTHLFDASSGAVWDAVNMSGKVGTWSSTYNQGTFVGLANFLGDTASAKLAADYTMAHLGKRTTGGVPDHAGVRFGGRQQLGTELDRAALDRKVHEGPQSSEQLFGLASGQRRHRLECPADLGQSFVVSVASADSGRRPAFVGLYQHGCGASGDR